ncbi:MAG: four helix bundle protein [Terracidiphilus sp.]
MGQSFKDLVAWQKSTELTVEIYKLTSKFPDSERFGLTNQIRRAAVSVASNIAEGYGRSTKGEYYQFLGHSRGSCCELETQVFVARKLGFGTTSGLDATKHLCNDVGRLLGALMKSIQPRRPSVP